MGDNELLHKSKNALYAIFENQYILIKLFITAFLIMVGLLAVFLFYGGYNLIAFTTMQQVVCVGDFMFFTILTLCVATLCLLLFKFKSDFWDSLIITMQALSLMVFVTLFILFLINKEFNQALSEKSIQQMQGFVDKWDNVSFEKHFFTIDKRVAILRIDTKIDETISSNLPSKNGDLKILEQMKKIWRKLQ